MTGFSSRAGTREATTFRTTSSNPDGVSSASSSRAIALNLSDWPNSVLLSVMSFIRPEKYVYYFCDESSQVRDPYMAVAGLAVPDAALAKIRADLVEIRKANGNPREVKWSTTKARRDSPERAFADYFEAAIRSGQIHFHIRFAPFDEYDHKTSGPRLRSDTTSKMHFQLLLHRALRYYGHNYSIRICPDNGDCTRALPGQVETLQWMASGKYNTPADCIDSVRCMNSEREPLLQLLDVPLGAFTALRNGRELSAPKRELADYIKAKWPDLDLQGNTPAGKRGFVVWNVKPKDTRRRDPWS